MEIFKEIKDYPDYQVSNYGNVKSMKYKKQRILKSYLRNGYPSVFIFNKNGEKREYIHRLIVKSFIRDLVSSEQIDHIDGNRLNNKLENLDIVNHRINNLRKKSIVLPGAVKTKNDKFRSVVKISGRSVYIGTFNTREEAHEAYKNKLKEYGVNIDFNQDLVCMLDDNKI